MKTDKELLLVYDLKGNMIKSQERKEYYREIKKILVPLEDLNNNNQNKEFE